MTLFLLVVISSENTNNLIPGDQIVKVVLLDILFLLLQLDELIGQLSVELSLLIRGQQNEIFLLLFIDGEFRAKLNELFALFVNLLQILPGNVEEQKEEFFGLLIYIEDQLVEGEEEQETEENTAGKHHQRDGLCNHNGFQILRELGLNLKFSLLELKEDIAIKILVIFSQIKNVNQIIIIVIVQIIDYSSNGYFY